jgi:hypothetical protein
VPISLKDGIESFLPRTFQNILLFSIIKEE